MRVCPFKRDMFVSKSQKYLSNNRNVRLSVLESSEMFALVIKFDGLINQTHRNWDGVHLGFPRLEKKLLLINDKNINFANLEENPRITFYI